jgi:hypothetical protein
MQYGAHKREEDGSIGEPLTDELFESEEAARMWLVKAAQKDEIELKVGGYSVETYDDEGNHVVLVPEEEAEKAREDASRLMVEDEDVRKAVGTMISARQIYSVAVRELERLLDAMDPPPHGDVIDIFMQTASNEAGKPFDETVLFNGLMETTVPWLQKIVREHVDEDQLAEQKQIAEDEERRIAVPVPIGISTEKEGPTFIDRETPVILAGPRAAVTFLLDHITTQVMTATSDDHPNRVFTVLRFADRSRREDAHVQLVRVAKSVWQGCCEKSNGIPTMMAEHVAPQLSAMPDLLICDEMQLAATGVVGSRVANRAATAFKGLDRWCREVGCAFVGGIPLGGDDAPNVVGNPSYERIRAKGILRPVSIIREADDLAEGQCRILVGRDAFSMDVDKELLQGSSIVLPG